MCSRTTSYDLVSLLKLDFAFREELQRSQLFEVEREEQKKKDYLPGRYKMEISRELMKWIFAGIKEYSDWPTIPQLYIDKEFVGGCDILINMHKDGSLAELLSEKKVILEEEPSSGSS